MVKVLSFILLEKTVVGEFKNDQLNGRGKSSYPNGKQKRENSF